MEKRLFLAIGISLLVVWLWSGMAPKSQQPAKANQEAQLFVNKEDEKGQKIIEDLPPPAEALLTDAEKETKALAKTEILDSEKLRLEISNIGAALESITIKEYDTVLPLKGIARIAGYGTLPFILDEIRDGEIKFSYEDNDFKIVKSYVIGDEDYIIEAKIDFQNKTEMSKLININVESYVIEMSSLDKKSNGLDRSSARDKSLNEYAINTGSEIFRKSGAFKFSPKETKDAFGDVLWTGFRNRYFCALIKPQYDTTGYTVDSVNEEHLKVTVKSKGVSVLPGRNVRFDSIIYAGPEKTDILKSYGLGFEKIKKYYRFVLFDGIAKIIDNLMNILHKIIPNWGICIMLISIIIYFSMYPLTMRGMLSMKRMQSLQPLIANLKEKHKDSPQKMNKEMMELYKEHKVNPLGGCLPMLLQMPVFIGLYQVLWRSVSFKGAQFLWIKDLSQPDRLFIFPFNLPVLGNELNLLPLIMVVVMFFQQKLSTKNLVSSDPSQVAQQKMMATIMPIFLGFIFYKFASGLTLYFTMFYFFSTFTQWKMSKETKVK